MRNLKDRELFGCKLHVSQDTNWRTTWKDKLMIQLHHNEKSVTFTDRFGASIPPYACDFATDIGKTGCCLAVDEEGYVSVIDTDQFCLSSEDACNPILKEKWVTHNNAVFDVKFVPRSQYFVTASGDTTAAYWDVSRPKVKITSFHGHSCSLKSVSVSKHIPSMFATGSRDGNIMIWDSRCSQISTAQIKNAHVVYDSLTPQRKRRRCFQDNGSQLYGDSRQTVTSVVFQTSNMLISSGAMDGTVKLWDIRKISNDHGSKPTSCNSYPIEKFFYPGDSDRRRGYNSLCLDSTSTRLFASCTDNVIYEYDLSSRLGTQTPAKRYTGHYSSSFYVRIALSPDNLHLLSGCDDNMAYIWNVNEDCGKFSQPSYCVESEQMQQVTSVAWCPTDNAKFVTCSDDAALRIWKVPNKFSSQNLRGSITCLKKNKKISNETGTVTNKPTGFFRRASMNNLTNLKNSGADQQIDKEKKTSPHTKLRQKLISTSFQYKTGLKVHKMNTHCMSSDCNIEGKENTVMHCKDTPENIKKKKSALLSKVQEPPKSYRCKTKSRSYSIKSYFNTNP